MNIQPLTQGKNKGGKNTYMNTQPLTQSKNKGKNKYPISPKKEIKPPAQTQTKTKSPNNPNNEIEMKFPTQARISTNVSSFYIIDININRELKKIYTPIIYSPCCKKGEEISTIYDNANSTYKISKVHKHNENSKYVEMDYSQSKETLVINI